MVEAPGTAPGSETLMPRGVYRHSRFPDDSNIGAPRAFLKAGAAAIISPWKGLLAAHRVRGQRRTSTMPLSTDQQAEIDQARGGGEPTLRPVAPALEEILFQALPRPQRRVA